MANDDGVIDSRPEPKTRPAKRRPRKPRPLTENHPDFNREHRRLLERNLKIVAAAKERSDLALWDEGNAWATIRDLKLFLQDGYPAMKRWVEEKCGRRIDWVNVLMRFAETYSREQVEAHGRTKLRLGEEYRKLTASTSDDGASIEALLVKVPDELNDRIAEKPFVKASEAELKKAVEHQRALAGRRGEGALSPEDQAILDHLLATFDGVLEEAGLAGRGSLRGVPADGDSGDALLEIAIPLREFSTLLPLLARRATRRDRR